MFGTVTTISKSIGALGPWSSIKIDGDTAEWVVTNKMELRLFDGQKYGKNVLEQRFMNRMRNLSAEFELAFHPNYGLVIFGVE